MLELICHVVFQSPHGNAKVCRATVQLHLDFAHMWTQKQETVEQSWVSHKHTFQKVAFEAVKSFVNKPYYKRDIAAEKKLCTDICQR